VYNYYRFQFLLLWRVLFADHLIVHITVFAAQMATQICSISCRRFKLSFANFANRHIRSSTIKIIVYCTLLLIFDFWHCHVSLLCLFFCSFAFLVLGWKMMLGQKNWNLIKIEKQIDLISIIDIVSKSSRNFDNRVITTDCADCLVWSWSTTRPAALPDGQILYLHHSVHCSSWRRNQFSVTQHETLLRP